MSPKKRKGEAEWKPPPSYAWNSEQAKAIKALHDLVDRTSAFFAVWRNKIDGSVTFSKEMTPQLMKFAEMRDPSTWVTLTYQQACAWEEFFNSIFPREILRKRMREGSTAPWYWPPSTEGKLYTDADAVPPLNTSDLDALANEGQNK